MLRATIFWAIFIALAVLSGALHTQEEENTQLKQLKSQQQYLGQQVSLMRQQSSSVKQRLAEATDDQSRVEILEEALRSQKQSVFDLKNKLIYPFNESTTACEQLSEQEKANILQELYQARSDLEQLQEINSKFDQSNSQVQNISQSLIKQFKLLQIIQEILKIKCKQNLSPTIFQSNLNAKNWILGTQTMENLQQQYAQRALIFHNVTNCPLETPFFNLRQQICIQCQMPDNIFNMYTKQCTRCNGDEQLDIEKRKCRSKPHYTNFSNVQNWNLDGGLLPQIDPELTPCLDSTPYYNGVICVRCELPQYWSVAPNLCKNCQQGQEFDMNTKKCEPSMKFSLSLLQNTHWISQDLTQVIEERVQILELNETTGQYKYCPLKMKPFYDGITCIFCKIFDMDTRICVQAPTGLIYDDNMKKFVEPEEGKQTNSNAKRYIAALPSKDTALQNCNSTHPYWDGLACVYCARPFDIFKTSERKCVVCNADQIFVQNKHKCVMRDKIHISENFNRLLATKDVSVPAYKQKLIETINNNPDAIVYPCPSKSDYSNITVCFPCKQNEYFDVETYKCVVCDGTYIDSNNTCKTKIYIFTNMKAGNIIDMGDKTVQGENKKVAEFLKNHPQSYVCPLQKPYAIHNQTCGTCPQLFSYSTLKCTQCTQYFIFVPDQKKCKQAKMIVNFTNPKKILVTQTETLSSFETEQQKIRAQYPKIAKVCPGEKPYTSSRNFCFNCSQQAPLFNYTKKECQSCPEHYIFDSEYVSCVQQFYITLINNNTEPQMLGYTNYTLETFKQQQQQIRQKNPYQNCTEAEPYGTLKGCKQCNQPTFYFNIKKKVCANAKFLTNFDQIKEDYIVPQDKNIQYYKSAQQKYINQTDQLTIICQKQKPYTNDRTYCFSCAEEEHFNFLSRACERCPETKAYVNQTKKCQDLFYVTNFTENAEKKMKGKGNFTISDYKEQQKQVRANNPFIECHTDKPYGTANGCRDCVEPNPFFNINKKVCASAKKLINFKGVDDNYIVIQDRPLKDYKEIQENYKTYSESLTVECDEETPYTTDRQYCFKCQEPTPLFNFESKKCQSCPLKSQFDAKSNRCLKLVYITNFNNDSDPRMIEFEDYTMETFKEDQKKLKIQNPYKNCTEETPFGTVDGCRQCQKPEQYYDIKNRKCTAVKRVINFAEVDPSAVITEKDKKIQDYQKQQENFQKQQTQPVKICPVELPFTSNRYECFACQQSDLLFNFETKECTSCKDNESYDSQTQKCIQKKFYTLLNPSTMENLIQDGNKTIADYEKQQQEIKKQTASEECPEDSPFAAESGCVNCEDKSPYFNIQTKSCESCEGQEQFFPKKHKCLKVTYLTNLENQNIMITENMSIEDAKKAQQQKANKPEFLGINCTGAKPFATQTECIECPQPQKPYFNIETLECVGCIQFYQYFEQNQCKDNIILINTKQMIGYIEVDNYTKYNVQKFNNFTYLQNDHVVDCPAEEPFYNDQICLNCPDDKPIFNLKDKKCQYIDVLLKSNVAAMKFYIEEGDETLKGLLNQIKILNPKVNIQFCPTDKPYLAGDECIACSEPKKYFNLGTEVCQTCGSNDNCFSV